MAGEFWLSDQQWAAIEPQLPLDPVACKQRNPIERMFCRLKDVCRIATRYDKLAVNFAAAVALAAILIWWA